MKKYFFAVASAFLVLLMLLLIGGQWLGFPSAYDQNVDVMLASPSAQHWFGTDSLGRDVFARVLLGGRTSLLVGILCSLLSMLFGFFYGAVAGWLEGWTDRLLMRFCDILMALPSFILVSILCFSLQLLLPWQDAHLKALVSLCVGISATHWMGLARVTRGMVMEIKQRPFVEAARALGGTQVHIILRHILPNMMGTLLVLVALQVPTNILYESFMSFIGLGIHPPDTSWGILVREGWKTLSSFPHMVLFPSLVLFLTVWSLHIVLDRFKEYRRY